MQNVARASYFFPDIPEVSPFEQRESLDGTDPGAILPRSTMPKKNNREPAATDGLANVSRGRSNNFSNARRDYYFEEKNALRRKLR
jgi:hypothetical protein